MCAPFGKLAALCLGLSAVASVHATDLFYKKSSRLYVIHDIDKGKTDEAQLDFSVGHYAADGGAVIYIKGNTLYLVRDTRSPKSEIVAYGVDDCKMQDGVIVFLKAHYLYVRKLGEDLSVDSRRVNYSHDPDSFHVAGGDVTFVKNLTTLYRVTNLQDGSSSRMVYPVGEVQLSD